VLKRSLISPVDPHSMTSSEDTTIIVKRRTMEHPEESETQIDIISPRPKRRMLARAQLQQPREYSDVPPESWFCPYVDVMELQNAVMLFADLPGVDKEDIEVSLDNGMLTIAGEKYREKEVVQGERHHVREIRSGGFSRSMSVPSDIRVADIQARLENGVLAVLIPKPVRTGREALPPTFRIPIE